MKEHPDYKYRPRRKPKTLRKDCDYPYTIPYQSVPIDALSAGNLIIYKKIKKKIHVFFFFIFTT